MADRIHVNVYVHGQFRDEMEIPTDITAISFIQALNTIYKLGMSSKEIHNHYLKADYPKGLIRGNIILKDIGLRNGSEVWLEQRDMG